MNKIVIKHESYMVHGISKTEKVQKINLGVPCSYIACQECQGYGWVRIKFGETADCALHRIVSHRKNLKKRDPEMKGTFGIARTYPTYDDGRYDAKSNGVAMQNDIIAFFNNNFEMHPDGEKKEWFYIRTSLKKILDSADYWYENYWSQGKSAR